MKKLILFLFVVSVVLSSAIGGFLYMTDIEKRPLPDLKNGDLVFQTTKAHQSWAIMVASETPYTHVGIVKIDKTNKVKIVEAIGPVREIPLVEWIDQGVGRRIMVNRMRGLTNKKALEILKEAKKYYGRPYDFFFQMGKAKRNGKLINRDKIYCSELIHYAFKEGGRIPVGNVTRLSDLKNVDNFIVSDLIKKRWREHPLCRNGQVNNFESCKFLVMEQKIITPESLANDNAFEKIYTNYKW